METIENKPAAQILHDLESFDKPIQPVCLNDISIQSISYKKRENV